MRRALLFIALALALVKPKGSSGFGGVGKKQHDKSAKGHSKKPNLDRFYSHNRGKLLVHDFEFKLTLHRTKQAKELELDTVVERFDWNESGGPMTGSITLKRPENNQASLPILRGHVVRCQVRQRSGSDQWVEVFRMRCGFPETDPGFDEVIVELSDDLEALDRGEKDWRFRERKGKRKWRADQITRKVLKRCGVPAGKLAKGKADIRRMRKEKATGLQVIRAAYARERKSTGRQFVMRMNRGRFEVTPFRRNPLLYVLSEQIEQALLTSEGKDRPVTVVIASGRVGKAQKKEKFIAKRPDVVRRLGYIEKEVDVGKVDSRADLKHAAFRALADELRVKQLATLTHAGIPFIRKGDGIQLLLPGDGYKGDPSFVYVSSISHSVEGAIYTMDLDVNADDAFLADKQRREAAAKDKKRKKREKAHA